MSSRLKSGQWIRDRVALVLLAVAVGVAPTGGPAAQPTASVSDVDRSELEARAAHATIVSGAVLIRSVRDHHRRVDILRQASNIAEALRTQGLRFEQRADRFLAVIDEMATVYEYSVALYFDTLRRAAEENSADTLNSQLAAMSGELSQAGLAWFYPFAALFVAQATAYSHDGVLDREALLTQLLEM